MTPGAAAASAQRAEEFPTAAAAIDHWLQLIRGEYLEIPGLQLTKPQIRRLWGLDPSTCEAIVGALVETKFLAATRGNLYRRFQGEH
jgi:hypothetical protein